jgi:thymidylate synthase (FAD)
MAQITRHRHATFDIQSMRYVSFEDADPTPGEAVVTIPEFDTTHPAGRNADMDSAYEGLDEDVLLDLRREKYENAIRQSFEAYQDLLSMGVAPENARMVLPIGTKVNMVFSVNARMLMHIGDMRASGEAQWEIREMTEEVLDRAEEWCPHTFRYYNEEMKNRKNRLAP